MLIFAHDRASARSPRRSRPAVLRRGAPTPRRIALIPTPLLEVGRPLCAHRQYGKVTSPFGLAELDLSQDGLLLFNCRVGHRGRWPPPMCSPKWPYGRCPLFCPPRVGRRYAKRSKGFGESRKGQGQGSMGRLKHFWGGGTPTPSEGVVLVPLPPPFPSSPGIHSERSWSDLSE